MNKESLPANANPLEHPNGSALIFLAEDDIDDQELLMEAMAQYDRTITFRTATNGKKALDFLQSLPHTSLPTLIVLDYNLPELNGAQILEALRQDERFRHVPTAVWSTSNSDLYKNHCLSLGAMAYFVKPSDLFGIGKLAQDMLALCRR